MSNGIITADVAGVDWWAVPSQPAFCLLVCRLVRLLCVCRLVASYLDLNLKGEEQRDSEQIDRKKSEYYFETIICFVPSPGDFL